MVKHNQTIRRHIADELFESVFYFFVVLCFLVYFVFLHVRDDLFIKFNIIFAYLWSRELNIIV